MAHNKSTHAIMRATNEIDYLQEVCTIIVEDCGHAMVWIGYAEHDQGRTIRPVAYSGFEEGYLETLNLTWADTERGRGPTGMAIRTGKISTCRNMLTDPFFKPWKKEALKRGYASSIVFPLQNGDTVFGAITIYSREPDPFYEDEVKLLYQLAKDLAYGVHTIRLRIDHDAAQKELLRHREHLEKLVKERTLELEERNRQLEKEIQVRKRTEEALRKSTEETRDLYNKAPCGYHSLNEEGVFVRINDTELNWLGYDREEVIGKMKFSDILTPESLQLFKSSFLMFKKQGWIYDLEHELVRKDGSVMPVLLSATAIRDRDGEFVMSRSTLFDVSERKQLDKEIRNAADDWQMTFDSIKDHVMILDNEFRIIRINAAAASFFDNSMDKVRHSRCFSLMHHTDGPVQGCPFALTLNTKRHEEMEHFDTVRNRWFLESVDPIMNENGEIIRVIHTMKDVTDRKQAEEERKRLEIQLVQAQKMEALGTMAGGIAHDFNNILQPILINSDLISDMLDPDSKEREYLDQIVEATRLGKNLVRQIKLFGAKKKNEYKPIVMSNVVEEALNFFRNNSLPRGILFRQWIMDHDGLVLADPTQVYQLILNLCMNAVQAMKSGKGFLGISLKKTKVNHAMPAMITDIRPGWYEKLTVRDTGCGINKAVMGQIFDPFFTTKNSSKGTGLGLAIVHEVIKNIGGSILIRSAIDKGSRFEIFFPLHPGDQDQADVSFRKVTGPGMEKHILLVDDSVADRRSIHQLLLHLGHRVASTSDPNEALNIFRDDPAGFDMLITDQVMPRMRGNMLAMQIHRIRKDIPVIICSGSEDILLELKEKEKEIGEFILKPFSRSQLIEAMNRVLGTSLQS